MCSYVNSGFAWVDYFIFMLFFPLFSKISMHFFDQKASYSKTKKVKKKNDIQLSLFLGRVLCGGQDQRKEYYIFKSATMSRKEAVHFN